MATRLTHFNYEYKILLFCLNDSQCIQTVYDFAADHSLRYLQSFIRKTPQLLRYFKYREGVLKVLLVSANTETINMPVLPLGLGYVAAATQIAGYDIKLLNLLDQKDSLSLLKKTVHDFRPDVIGISVRNDTRH